MHTLRPLEDTPTIKKPMAMVIDYSIFLKQITCASLQQENSTMAGTRGAGNIQIGNKARSDHVILRVNWINSLRNCRCYNTVGIDSEHRIVTATVKFSFSTGKSYHI